MVLFLRIERNRKVQLVLENGRCGVGVMGEWLPGVGLEWFTPFVDVA